jgi:hypothetical protein
MGINKMVKGRNKEGTKQPKKVEQFILTPFF